MGKAVGSLTDAIGLTDIKGTRERGEQAAAAQAAAAREAAELAKFKPYSVTTRLGRGVFDANTQTASMDYNPELAAYRDRLFALAPQLLPADIRQAEIDEYNALRSGSQRGFEELTAQLGTNLFRTGRQGLDIYGAQPETRSFASALIDRENQLREQARSKVAADLAQAQGLFGGGLEVENALLQPLMLGEQFGKTGAMAGANAGQMLGQGLQASAKTRLESANAASAQLTGFMNKALGAAMGAAGMPGGGGGASIYSSIGNMFGNPMTAMQYGTNIGSQQTRMLAEQNRFF
jgi:hypothetical protein